MSPETSGQVITCKAAICWGVGEKAKVEEIQVEPPQSSEVRVKLLYASLCHTDILFSIDAYPFPVYPRVLGHEGVGVVESVGHKVKNLKEGDFVIPTTMGECQECENCISGKTNLCSTYPMTLHGLMLDNSSRMSIGGQRLYHFFSCSTWSEYTVVNANYVVKIDPTSIPLAHAGFLSCGFSTGFGTIWKEAKVEKGSSVAVLGLGAVGFGAVESARIAGAGKIIGVDKNEKRKEKGLAFGLTEFINPSNYSNKSISELIKDSTGGIGVDYCIECTGVTQLINEAILATKKATGKIITIGGGYDVNAMINYNPIAMGATLKGSVFGGLKVKSDLHVLFEKCKNKEFHLDELLTHEIALEDVAKAYELLKQPDCLKILIKI